VGDSGRTQLQPQSDSSLRTERWTHAFDGRQRVLKRLTVNERREPLSPELRAELVEVFRDEVALLGRLMGRDLAHWR